VPFLRRRPESEPTPPAPEPAPAPPATPAPPEEPVAIDPPLLPETQAEPPVESQFRPVEGADEMLDMPLGTLIFRAGLIAPQQLEDALAEGLRSGKRLGEVLLSRGWLSEEDLSRLLAGQKGLPYADLEKIAIDRELARAMSYDDARAEMALPVVTEFGVPVVAMADPDEAAMEALRAQLGPEVRFVVAAPSVLTRLIDEILGGAPAPGLLVAPTAVEPYSPDYLSAEPVSQEAAPELAAAAPEPAAPEPAVVDSVEQEEIPVPAPEPEAEAPEVQPIIAEGEVDYPTFSEYQPIPQPESISGPEEQLPEEVQMGDFGYYDDPSLLEGNAWRAGETGPPTEPPAESAAALEPEQPLETEQPLEAEQPTAEAWEEPAQEPYLEATPESVTPEPEEPASEQLPEPPEEGAEPSPGEEDLLSTTPAWMRGEVNVITADVADFIDSAGSSTPESSDAPPIEGADVVGGEPEPVLSESETPVESAQESYADDLEAAETAAEQAEIAEPVEQGETGSAGDAYQEPAAASAPSEEELPRGDNRGEFELVLRLADGDRIEIGVFSSVDKARERAGEVVKQFAEMKEGGGWPFIGGRFLRPETIVSIDVEEHGTDWGGSNSRGRMFSGDESAFPPEE
jgi:hypothetical protein